MDVLLIVPQHNSIHVTGLITNIFVTKNKINRKNNLYGFLDKGSNIIFNLGLKNIIYIYIYICVCVCGGYKTIFYFLFQILTIYILLFLILIYFDNFVFLCNKKRIRVIYIF